MNLLPFYESVIDNRTENSERSMLIPRLNETVQSGNHTNQNICLSYCIPNAILISIISICGIIANIVVMVIIKVDKRLHTPTFIAIIGLAISDFTFLLSRYIRYLIDGYFRYNMTKMSYRITKVTFDYIGLIAAGSSILHIVTLSLLRYFIVVHPLKAHATLTIKKSLLISGVMWLVAIVNGSIYLYAVIINTTDRKLQRITNDVVTIVMMAFPLSTIFVLHIFKAKALLNSLSATEETVRKMSRVVTFVICSYIITTLPSNLLDIAKFILPKEALKSKLYFHLAEVGRVLMFLNFAINPFLYFVFSPQFKRFFSEHWSKKRTSLWRSSNSGSGLPNHYNSVPLTSKTESSDLHGDESSVQNNNQTTQQCKSGN